MEGPASLLAMIGLLVIKASRAHWLLKRLTGWGWGRESLGEGTLPFVQADFVSARASRCPAQDRFEPPLTVFLL